MAVRRQELLLQVNLQLRLSHAYIKEYRRNFPMCRFQVTTIENRFFGEKITVSGLITGQDLKEQLSGSNSERNFSFHAVC